MTACKDSKWSHVQKYQHIDPQTSRLEMKKNNFNDGSYADDDVDNGNDK